MDPIHLAYSIVMLFASLPLLGYVILLALVLLIVHDACKPYNKYHK